MTWFKRAQFSYGYHGTDPTQVENIKMNGLGVGTFFASNEDDISPYVDQVWLRFPFPYMYEQKSGMGDYYITGEIVPPEHIEIKTDVWGDYTPL